MDEALKDAREIDHAPSLMYALTITSMTHLFLGNYAAATAQTDELLAVAEEKSAHCGRRSDGQYKVAVGLEPPFLGSFHCSDRFVNAAPSIVELATVRIGFPEI